MLIAKPPESFTLCYHKKVLELDLNYVDLATFQSCEESFTTRGLFTSNCASACERTKDGAKYTQLKCKWE